MSEKKAITKEVARRYRKARKKEKGGILDEFVATTGYNRNYASWVLSNWGREISRRLKNWDKIVLVKDPKLKKKRIRLRIYDGAVLPPLKKVWGNPQLPLRQEVEAFPEGDSAGLRETPGDYNRPCHPKKNS